MGLIFYIWFDEQSHGNLNFNFINSGHEHLPFRTKLDFVDSMDKILTDFLTSRYLNGIPWNELENPSSNSNHNTDIEFKLKVYKEIIKSTKAQQWV